MENSIGEYDANEGLGSWLF